MKSGNAARGVLLGAIGVASFSLTLPMTRLAVADFDPVIVGLGRALVAAALAAALLGWKRDPFPREHWRGLLVVGGGVVIGFPLLTSFALRHTPAAHSAVVTGLLPLATAFFAVLRAHERPSRSFWMAAGAGSVAVVVFALAESSWQLHPADGLLVCAVILCGLGYAEGGRLARKLGGWRVISWALVLTAPLLLAPVGWRIAATGLHGSATSWLALSYVSVVSMFLGFIAWYQGLALGGVARIGQLQLLQPFLTLSWAALLLNERLTMLTVATAAFVVLAVLIGRRSPVVAPVAVRTSN